MIRGTTKIARRTVGRSSGAAMAGANASKARGYVTKMRGAAKNHPYITAGAIGAGIGFGALSRNTGSAVTRPAGGRRPTGMYQY